MGCEAHSLLSFMRYYAIPDIHGMFNILEQCFLAIEKHVDDDYHYGSQKNYKIITLGDYIDRGPDSARVIQCLMDTQKKWPLICLKGNHEDIMMRTFKEKLSPEWWFCNGGEATVRSYGAKRDGMYWEYNHYAVPMQHRDWVDQLPLFHETDKHVFVHAGVPADDLDLKDQNEERLMWMLYARDDPGGFRGKHVVHGHHIHEDGPHEWDYRTALDTGSFYTNRQVIGVFDDTQGRAKEFIEIRV